MDDAVAQLQPAGAVYFRMHEDDVNRILAFEPTMIGSDGLPHDEFPPSPAMGNLPAGFGILQPRQGVVQS